MGIEVNIFEGILVGGLYEFIELVNKDGRFEYKVVEEINNKKSNKRQIFSLQLK